MQYLGIFRFECYLLAWHNCMHGDVLCSWMNLFLLHKLLDCFSPVVTEAFITVKTSNLVACIWSLCICKYPQTSKWKSVILYPGWDVPKSWLSLGWNAINYLVSKKLLRVLLKCTERRGGRCLKKIKVIKFCTHAIFKCVKLNSSRRNVFQNIFFKRYCHQLHFWCWNVLVNIKTYGCYCGKMIVWNWCCYSITIRTWLMYFMYTCIQL